MNEVEDSTAAVLMVDSYGAKYTPCIDLAPGANWWWWWWEGKLCARRTLQPREGVWAGVYLPPCCQVCIYHHNQPIAGRTNFLVARYQKENAFLPVKTSLFACTALHTWPCGPVGEPHLCVHLQCSSMKSIAQLRHRGHCAILHLRTLGCELVQSIN